MGRWQETCDPNAKQCQPAKHGPRFEVRDGTFRGLKWTRIKQHKVRKDKGAMSPAAKQIKHKAKSPRRGTHSVGLRLVEFQEQLRRDADRIGVAAVKYFDLRQNRNSDYRPPVCKEFHRLCVWVWPVGWINWSHGMACGSERHSRFQ